MYVTNIRKVGGSMMLAIPPVLLDILHLGVGAQVGMDINQGKLVVEPTVAPEYTLEQLLAQCNPNAVHSFEEREWVGGMAVGNELI